MNDKKQGIIYIIMAGFFFALMTFFVRMSGNLPTMQKAFFRNAVAAVALFAGAAATGGQLSITKAYTKAPAKEISVFDYSQVIFAALLGFVFLQQIPDYLSVIGYVIIIGSAIFKWNYNLRYEEKV